MSAVTPVDPAPASRASRRGVITSALAVSAVAGTGLLGAPGLADAAYADDTLAPTTADALGKKGKKKKPKLLTGKNRNLVSKFSYGITPALAAEVRKAGGSAKWFEKQLKPGAIKDPAADAMGTWWPSLNLSAQQLWQRNIREIEGGWEAMANYQRWLLMRRIHSKRQVLESMTEFWENHLHVPVNGDAQFTYRAAYGKAIRTHALGRFDEMLFDAITHPAMLIYLSAAVSTKDHPNENLGRELLELHTVGRGNYDEDDVKASARILTGWHVEMWSTWAASYRTEDHWTGPVRVMGFKDANVSTDGRAVTKRYLSYLAHHPATARRIVTKLAVRFCRDVPPQSLIDKLAGIYRANNTDIRPVLRALVASSAFQTGAASKVRDPGQDVVATYRALRVSIRRPARDDSVANAVIWQTAELGQMPLAWPQPNGAPQDNASWSSPARLLASMDMHQAMSGAWWPTRDASYRKATAWLPAKEVPFHQLVDHMSREILHQRATPQLQRACGQAVGARPGETINADHPVMKWLFYRLLTTFLDTPTHLTR